MCVYKATIHNPTLDYVHYASGYRYKNDKWLKSSTKSYTYPAFMHYMALVFSYAGTLSLDKELHKVTDATGLKQVMYLSTAARRGIEVLQAKSFMPAQNIQVLQQNDDP